MTSAFTTPSQPRHSITLESKLFRAAVGPVEDLDLTPVIYFQTYYPFKITPCGYWVNDYGKSKFINASWKKQFAWPTKELAVESLLIRKRIEKDKIEQRLQRVNEELRALEVWSERRPVQEDLL